MGACDIDSTHTGSLVSISVLQQRGLGVIVRVRVQEVRESAVRPLQCVDAKAQITVLKALPLSRVFLLGMDDGTVRVTA